MQSTALSTTKLSIHRLLIDHFCRKSLFTASTLPGPVASAEAQELRCKTTPTNGIPTPVGADMRRPSSGSAMSASSIDAGTTAATMSSSGAGLLSNGSLHQSGGGGGGGESHVPHMICTFFFPSSNCSVPITGRRMAVFVDFWRSSPILRI